MRRAGFVDTVEGLRSHDHICSVFDTPEGYRSVVEQFLAEGLAGGQRVVFVADRAREDELDGFAAARAAGAAQVRDLGTYGGGGPVDPDAQVRGYAAMTERAVADGFSGCGSPRMRRRWSAPCRRGPRSPGTSS